MAKVKNFRQSEMQIMLNMVVNLFDVEITFVTS